MTTLEPALQPEHAEAVERQRHRAGSAYAGLWRILDGVMDPELPALSIWDLGVLQDVGRSDDDAVVVTITPTYAGCPAMQAIIDDIVRTLACAGEPRVRVQTRLQPAWTTDWLMREAREKLRQSGIAAPEETVRCPVCDSTATAVVSEYGSTACKSLHRCLDCLEVFDRFKVL